MMSAEDSSPSPLHSSYASVVLFAFFFVVGSSYIVWSKSAGISPYLVTGVPVAFIFLYAALLVGARFLRLRDDQAGDNLYYIGFLYTLTSLGVSLWEFTVDDGGGTIVTNFGIAVATTIVGVALRVIFNQMRQDPLEVERVARLELADAARRVRQELDQTVLEFSSFRRSSLQIFEEYVRDTKEQAERVSQTIFDGLKDLPSKSAEPLAAASKQAEEALEALRLIIQTRLEESGAKIGAEEDRLADSAHNVTEALALVDARLRAMQTPEGIIEIKLQPFIQGLTKAVNNFSSQLDAQHDKIVDGIKSSVGAAEAIGRAIASNQDAGNQRADKLNAVVSHLDMSLQELSSRLAASQEARAAVDNELRDQLQRNREGLEGTVRLIEELGRRFPSGVAKPQVSEGGPFKWWQRGAQHVD